MHVHIGVRRRTPYRTEHVVLFRTAGLTYHYANIFACKLRMLNEDLWCEIMLQGGGHLGFHPGVGHIFRLLSVSVSECVNISFLRFVEYMALHALVESKSILFLTRKSLETDLQNGTKGTANRVRSTANDTTYLKVRDLDVSVIARWILWILEIP